MRLMACLVGFRCCTHERAPCYCSPLLALLSTNITYTFLRDIRTTRRYDDGNTMYRLSPSPLRPRRFDEFHDFHDSRRSADEIHADRSARSKLSLLARAGDGSEGGGQNSNGEDSSA